MVLEIYAKFTFFAELFEDSLLETLMVIQLALERSPWEGWHSPKLNFFAPMECDFQSSATLRDVLASFLISPFLGFLCGNNNTNNNNDT